MEPVFLTQNGGDDLIAMDMDIFSRRESMIKLREQLVKVEEDRLMGKKGFSIDEMDKMLQKEIVKSTNE